ncbi:MAG: hypothetical protein U0441_08265 [Polyangiaceae bacterium]
MSTISRILPCLLMTLGLSCSAGTAAVDPPAASPKPAPKPSIGPVQTALAVTEPPPPVCEPLRTKGFDKPEHVGITLPDTPIQWGDRLTSFYEALARMERGKLNRPLRIGVHGDSNLTKDGLTGEMRRVLQARYGDAGHGFMAAVKAWGWYRHQNVRQGNDAWWRVLAISAPRTPDLGYGIGGVAATCRSPGGRTWFETAEEGAPIGHDVGEIGVFYRRHPGGGRFQVEVDGKKLEEIATEAESAGVGRKSYKVSDGPHRFDILTTSDGEVRILGVTFERDKPGVVVDSFGVGGVYFQALTLDDHETTRRMEAERPHDLVVYWLGANPHYAKLYDRDVKTLMDERRKERPSLPVLIVSPPDRPSQGKNSPSESVSQTVTSLMRGAAEVNQCAFWPMRDAQGGDGAGGKFLDHGLSVDKQHLSPDGSNLMARVLLHELWKDYERYVAAHPRAGCDDPPGEKAPPGTKGGAVAPSP